MTPVWRAFVLIAGVAFGLRLFVILAASDSTLFSDMSDYHIRAEILVQGKPLPDSFRGAGYPVFLAVLYALPGDDLMAARVGHAVLGAATAVLATLLAGAFVGRRAALMAGVIVAVYPAGVLSSIYIMPESLYGFLCTLALVVAQRPTLLRTGWAGVVAAAAAMTRSLGLALLPSMLAGLAVEAWRLRRWPRVALQGAVLVLACLAALTPWLRHTSRVSGGLLLDSASGFNILLGANPRARERLEIADSAWVWDTYLGGPIDEAERNRRAIAHSWNWIRDNPGAWLRLVPQKMAYLWGLDTRRQSGSGERSCSPPFHHSPWSPSSASCDRDCRPHRPACTSRPC
jgi:branched-subunit amino acid transport protein